ncbi:MAG: lysophospholipase [Planctomyces sp.]|nr:lysophospholipase [Planctomyces sp.]
MSRPRFLCLFTPLLLLMSIASCQGEPTYKEKTTDVRVIVLGDSITKGVRTGVAADEIYQYLVEQKLSTPERTVEVLNEGIGGERTDQALARLDRTVIFQKPDIVTIMYGTNDSYVDSGKQASRLTVAEYRSNLKEIVNRLQNERIQVVLMTSPRWGAPAKNGLSENPNLKLEPFVEACRAVAEEMQLPLVDHYQHWKEAESEGANLSNWTTDECHPNAAGHQQLADVMMPVLEPVVKSLKMDAAKAE